MLRSSLVTPYVNLSKLNSVPDLEGIKAPAIESIQPSNNTDSAPTTEPNSFRNQEQPNILSSEADGIQTEASEPLSNEANKGENEIPMSPDPAASPVNKDPRFAPYFKMLAVGVPLPAVQMKMRSEGLEPSILDDPNAPAPPLIEDCTQLQEDSDSSSVSSFSD